MTGSYGVEGRFPFLDPAVVQANFHLTPALKNTYYKAAIQLYMRKYGYPHMPCIATAAHPFGRGSGCKKVGFVVRRGGQSRSALKSMMSGATTTE